MLDVPMRKSSNFLPRFSQPAPGFVCKLTPYTPFPTTEGPPMLHSRNIAKVLQQGFKPSQLTDELPLAVALITRDGELLSTAMEKSIISNSQLEGDSSFSKSTLSKNDLKIYALVAIREFHSYRKTQEESGSKVENWHATTIGERRVLLYSIENTDLLLLSVTRVSYPGDIALIRSQILSETLAAGLQGFKLTAQ